MVSLMWLGPAWAADPQERPPAPELGEVSWVATPEGRPGPVSLAELRGRVASVAEDVFGEPVVIEGVPVGARYDWPTLRERAGIEPWLEALRAGGFEVRRESRELDGVRVTAP